MTKNKFEHSPLYYRMRHISPEALRESLSTLPDPFYDGYIKSVQEKKDSQKTSSVIEWLLLHYFFITGLLQMRIFVNNENVYSIGAEIFNGPPLPHRDSFFGKDAILSHLYLRSEEGGGFPKIELECALPAKTLNISQLFIQSEFFVIIKNHFMHLPQFRKPWRIDLIAETDKTLNSIFEPELKKNKPVTVSHFHIQNLDDYFGVLGEQKVLEILDEVSRTIHSHAKRIDLLMKLNLRSFLLVTPGMEDKQVLERYSSVFIHVRSLVLDYNLYTVTLREYPVDLFKLYRDLHIV